MTSVNRFNKQVVYKCRGQRTARAQVHDLYVDTGMSVLRGGGISDTRPSPSRYFHWCPSSPRPHALPGPVPSRSIHRFLLKGRTPYIPVRTCRVPHSVRLDPLSEGAFPSRARPLEPRSVTETVPCQSRHLRFTRPPLPHLPRHSRGVGHSVPGPPVPVLNPRRTRISPSMTSQNSFPHRIQLNTKLS